MFAGIVGVIIELLACWHITTMMTVVNFSLVFIFFALLFTPFAYIPLLYGCWYLYDRKTPFEGGRQFSFWRNMTLWKYLARYFPVKLHKTQDLDPTKNYIFAFHPHGMFVFGGVCNFCTNATGFDEMFPGIKVHMLVLNGQFKFPVYRDYLISAGFGSANSASIDYKLSKIGPGNSIWLAIGGAAEVLLGEDPTSYKLKVLNRKGFIRKALKNGAPVVPVFSFGETRLYEISMPAPYTPSYFLQQIVKLVSNLTLPMAVHGKPWCWYLLPRRYPINTVVGAPLDFSSHCDGEPTQEAVDTCHALYLEALRKLYDEHKAKFGDENTPLIYT